MKFEILKPKVMYEFIWKYFLLDKTYSTIYNIKV